MRYIRTGSFKRLFSMKRRHSLEDLPKDSIFMKQDSFNNGETESFKKPTWKCFSFEEIYVATDGFCSGNYIN